MVRVRPGDSKTLNIEGIDILAISSQNRLDINSEIVTEEVNFEIGIRMISTAGKQVEIVGDCPFDECSYGACWNLEKRCLNGCTGGCEQKDQYRDYDGSLDMPDDKLLILDSGAEEPNNWEESFRTPELNVDIGSGVGDQVCPGDFVSIDFTLSQDHPIAEPTVNVSVTNELTGEVDDKGEETVTQDFDSSFFSSFDIPSNAPTGEQDIATISIEGSEDVDVVPSRDITLTANVGNSDDELVINTVNAPESACPGDSAELEVVAENTGSCNQDAFIRITDPSDSVTESSTSTIFSESTGTFRPTVTMPESGGDFSIELVRD